MEMSSNFKNMKGNPYTKVHSDVVRLSGLFGYIVTGTAGNNKIIRNVLS